jgi:hypothetical protein
MDTSVRLSGIVAKISADAMVDTGNGMATLWKYPSEMRDIIPMSRSISEDSPMPLDRLTVFDINKVMLPNGKTVSPLCECVTVEATVRHLSYGIMEAIKIVVLSTDTEN